MKLKDLALVALVLPFYADATEFGIGASVKDNESSIYFPMNLDEKTRIEPKLMFFTDTRDFDGYEIKQRNFELSVGVFGVQKVTDNVNTFIGGRLGVIKSKFEADNGYEEDFDGLSIEPSVGFEYYFVPKISIGGEVGLRHIIADQEVSDFTDEDYKSTSTTTSITLRYFF